MNDKHEAPGHDDPSVPAAGSDPDRTPARGVPAVPAPHTPGAPGAGAGHPSPHPPQPHPTGPDAPSAGGLQPPYASHPGMAPHLGAPPEGAVARPTSTRGRVLAWTGAGVAAVLVALAGGFGLVHLLGGEDEKDRDALAQSTTQPVYLGDLEFADVLLDVEPTHEFQIPIGWDPEALTDVPQGSAVDASTARVFVDPQLTIPAQDANVFVNSWDRVVKIAPIDYAMPMSLPDANDSLGYSDEQVELNTAGEWGMYQAYYIAEYRDSTTGEVLPAPRVTAFTVADDLPAVSSSVRVDGQGVATFTWQAVPGATKYYVMRADGDNARIIGTTTATSWTSIEQDRDIQRALAATSVYERDIIMMNGALASSGASDDDLAGGFGDAGGKDAAPGFGVVAVTADGTGPLRIDPGTDLVAQLPDVIALTAVQELGIQGRDVRTLDALPATYPISLADGSTVMRTVEYDVDGVAATDVLAGNLDDAGNVTETWHETEYTIPYRVAGTMFTGTYTVEAADLATAVAGAEAANQRAQAALARTGSAASYAYVAEVPDIDDESQISRTAPDVPYPVSGSNPLSVYLAANLLDGQRLIDVSAFLPRGSLMTSTGVGLWDAFDEAADQNPLAFVDGDVSVGYVADRQILTVTYGQGESAAEREAEQEQVAAEIDRVLDDILTDGMSERETVTAINDYLAETAEYDYDALTVRDGGALSSDFPNAWSATGVLIDKKGVCASYAQAFKALADAAGLESVYVTGVAVRSGEGHAWNKVKVDGAWRVVDPTWNDGSGNAYLLQTDAEAAGDRTADAGWMLDSRIADYAAS